MVSKKQMGEKIRDKIEEEASREAVNFYRAWRQKIKNGVLPIGIANVGKTTFLNRLAVNGSNLFLDFNRTLKIDKRNIRLREDLNKHAKNVEFYKSIDVPGDLPQQWTSAYFNNNPRILVILVDHRDSKDHVKHIREFLSTIGAGPSWWQEVKKYISFRWDNLSRIIFITNKTDKFSPEELQNIENKYKTLLSDIHSTFKVPVQLFQTSLQDVNDKELESIFKAVIEGLSSK